MSALESQKRGVRHLSMQTIISPKKTVESASRPSYAVERKEKTEDVPVGSKKDWEKHASDVSLDGKLDECSGRERDDEERHKK